MTFVFSSEELTATDRPPALVTDLDVISLGDEFEFDDIEIDASDLQCQPLLASDLPLNSELQGASLGSR